jgi:hypothetical protein
MNGPAPLKFEEPAKPPSREQAAAGALVEQVIQIQEGPGKAPHGTNHSLRIYVSATRHPELLLGGLLATAS